MQTKGENEEENARQEPVLTASRRGKGGQDGVRFRWFLVFSFSFDLISHTVNLPIPFLLILPFLGACLTPMEYVKHATRARAMIYYIYVMQRIWSVLLCVILRLSYAYTRVCVRTKHYRTPPKDTLPPLGHGLAYQSPRYMASMVSLFLFSARSAPLRFARV